MRVRLTELGLERGARTARYETPPPTKLYEKACKKVGQTFGSRDGDKSIGVVIAELPVLAVWKALNDENHHADEGSPIPVKHSEVIGGTPRGVDRLLFQYATQMGFGRWWVSRVWMNQELYESTDGMLWELLWDDQTAEADPEQAPMNTISSELDPVKQSHGAWLLVPIAESCTLVEYFNWSDPGGFVGFAQPLIYSKALRKTVGGIVTLAAGYETAEHPGPSFLLPDGTPLD